MSLSDFNLLEVKATLETARGQCDASCHLQRELSLSVLASRKVQGKRGQSKIDILIFHLLSAINEEGISSNSTPTATQEDDF